MLQRVESILAGARLAAAESEKLASADVIYARNLDMLATAFLAKRMAKLKTPVIYEVARRSSFADQERRRRSGV